MGPDTPLSRRVIAAAGGLAVALDAVLILVGWHGYHEPAWGFALAEAVGLSFTVAGWVVWFREPGNRLGPLMLLAGLCWYLTDLQFAGNGGLYAVSFELTYLDIVVFAHVALAYPSGRVGGRAVQALLGSAYAS